jgi:uncharacterized protein YbjT (DUF2867 family)
MELAVFGGSGRTGQALVAVALSHGWRVRAFVRTQAGAALPLPPGLVVVRGFSDYLPDIVDAVRRADAVCCVFGAHLESPEPFCAALTERIIDAMRGEAVRRLVCLTGAMIGAIPGNVDPAMRVMAGLFRWQGAEIAADRARQEAVVMASGLDWTLVKAPRLTDGPRTGAVQADPALPVGILSRVSRLDLADFLFRAATHNRFVGQKVYVRS